MDLGEWWAERTGGLPLPLGGNIIRRDLGPEMIRKVSKMLHDSIAYALVAPDGGGASTPSSSVAVSIASGPTSSSGCT